MTRGVESVFCDVVGVLLSRVGQWWIERQGQLNLRVLVLDTRLQSSSRGVHSDQ